MDLKFDQLREKVAKQFSVNQSAIIVSYNLQKDVEIDSSTTNYSDSTKNSFSFRNWKKFHGWDAKSGELVSFDSKETFYVNSDPGKIIRHDVGFKGQSRKLHDVDNIREYPVLCVYEEKFQNAKEEKIRAVTLYKNPLYMEGYDQHKAGQDQLWAERLT